MQATKRKTAENAVGRWPSILQAFGVDAQYLINKHGPCPICAGKDRYRFDDKEGRGTFICSHCGSGDGFKLLQKMYGWDFRHAAKEVDRIIGTVPTGSVITERTEESKLQVLHAVWQSSMLVAKDDPVWRYLNGRIGIDVVPSSIRFHPSLRHSDGGMHPAMLAKMTYPSGEAASIHRTYLTMDGQKAPVSKIKKLMQGRPLQTSCVRLGQVGRHLGIAEGIETALAASQRFSVPVWAATNAALLAAWVPPVSVEEVLIAGDHDASYTGQVAAYTLARRLVRDGYVVKVKFPGTEGNDWADEAI